VEIAVGATVILALVILIVGVYWLRDYNASRDMRVWHVTFPQTGGLGRSDEVQVNGVRKGAVKELSLLGDRVYVDLALADDVHLTSDSRVAIRNVGLMGEKVIAVDLKMTGVRLSERDTIQGIYELGLGEVMASMGGTITQVTELTEELRSVTQSLTADGHLSQMIRNFARTGEELRAVVAENRSELRSTMENFSAASRTARGLTADREAELRRALDQFTVAADNMARLSTRLDSLRTSIQTITSKVESGEGTLGKLVNDDKLYADVNSSVQSLKTLIEDIKKNPKKYLNISIF
jgi:phospholipid/cholesterol/gamma-HCH transport system substrate-binding protein